VATLSTTADLTCPSVATLKCPLFAKKIAHMEKNGNNSLACNEGLFKLKRNIALIECAFFPL